jgi:hypothetical protein
MKTKRLANTTIKARYLIAALLSLIVNVSLAHASPFGNPVIFATPTGSTIDGLPVGADVTFTTGPGAIHVLPRNEPLTNPTDIAQAISDISFTFSNGSSAGATITRNFGSELSVNSDGTFTCCIASESVGWGLNIIGPTTLEIDAPAPKHLILPSPEEPEALYSNANGSIAGNSLNNPFLAPGGSAFFISLLSPDTPIITSATFSFGLEGVEVPTAQTFPAVPIPAALPLFATGLAGLGLLGWRRKRKAAA